MRRNLAFADVYDKSWAASVLTDVNATSPIISKDAVDNMGHGHKVQYLDGSYAVPTSYGYIAVHYAVELEWNEFNDDKEFLGHGTSLFYVTDGDISPHDVIVHAKFGKR